MVDVLHKVGTGCASNWIRQVGDGQKVHSDFHCSLLHLTTSLNSLTVSSPHWGSAAVIQRIWHPHSYVPGASPHITTNRGCSSTAFGNRNRYRHSTDRVERFVRNLALLVVGRDTSESLKSRTMP